MDTERCPLTPKYTPVIMYCLAALKSGEGGRDNFFGTQYEFCRPQILNWVEHWSLKIRIITICVLLSCTIFITFVFYILRKKRRSYVVDAKEQSPVTSSKAFTPGTRRVMSKPITAPAHSTMKIPISQMRRTVSKAIAVG